MTAGTWTSAFSSIGNIYGPSRLSLRFIPGLRSPFGLFIALFCWGPIYPSPSCTPGNCSYTLLPSQLRWRSNPPGISKHNSDNFYRAFTGNLLQFHGLIGSSRRNQFRTWKHFSLLFHHNWLFQILTMSLSNGSSCLWRWCRAKNPWQLSGLDIWDGYYKFHGLPLCWFL